MQYASLNEIVHERCKSDPNRLAYSFLDENLNVNEQWTYKDLFNKTILWCSALESVQSQNILLAFPPGLDFIAAFLACSFSAKTAVPVHLPSRRSSKRFQQILHACNSDIVMTNVESGSKIRKVIESLLIETEINIITQDDFNPLTTPQLKYPTGKDIAFIQFTSGSTSEPKGVKVSHENIINNQEMIYDCFGHSRESRILGWLPATHDMGLIGIILQPLYAAAPCWLMSPSHFSRNPADWLNAISRFGITTSGGPNFSYDLCLSAICDKDLNLSTWQVAFNGAEPVNAGTLNTFIRTFSKNGFRPEAFLPCYGLAEATLFVSGKQHGTGVNIIEVDGDKLASEGYAEMHSGDKTLVSSGFPDARLQLKIVDPVSCKIVDEQQQGEIWLCGPSITSGYFNNEVQPFSAIAGETSCHWLRTGDLGFLHQGELFITARLKDLIIINGRNIYPQDIELKIPELDARIKLGAAGVFEYQNEGSVAIGILVEVNPKSQPHWEEIARNVCTGITSHFGVRVGKVAMTKYGALPRTTSGKIQRGECRQLASQAGENLAAVYVPSQNSAEVPFHRMNVQPGLISEFLNIINRYSGENISVAQLGFSFTQLGLDSISIFRFIAAIETHFGVRLNMDEEMADATLHDMLEHISHQAAVSSALPEAEKEQQDLNDGLSRLQMRYALLDQLQDEKYPLTVSAILALKGELDMRLLERCVLQVLKRHDAFWLRFDSEIMNNKVHYVAPEQVEIAYLLAVSQPNEAEKLQDDFFARPFNNTERLYRFALLTRQENSHELLICCHHIIFDGWSLDIFTNEVMAYYKAALEFTTPALSPAISYRALDSWLQSRHPEQRSSSQQNDYPLTQLPREPATSEGGSGSLTLTLTADQREAVAHLAKEFALSPAVIWMSLYGLTLARLSATTLHFIGTPCALRESPGALHSIGLYLSIIPVKIAIEGEMDFAGYCRQVAASLEESKQAATTLDHSDGANAQRPGFNPRCFINYLPNFRSKGEVANLEYRLQPCLAQTANFDLTLYVLEELEKCELLFTWRNSTFNQQRAAIFTRQLLDIIAQARSTANQPLENLQLASVHKLSAPEPNPWAGSVDQQAYRWAKTHGERIAVEYGEEKISYRQLTGYADNLALAFQQRGVNHQDIVAIIAERTPDLVLAILATLRLGAVYAVLDAAWPEARCSAALSVLSPKLVIDLRRQPLQATSFNTAATMDLSCFNDARCYVPDSVLLPAPEHGSCAPACITFTSGTTGVPKAILGSHGGLSAFLPWQVKRFALDHNARISMLSGLAHDPLQRDIFTAWWLGATLVIPNEDIISQGYLFRDWFNQQAISFSNLTPSMARLLSLGNPDSEPLTTLKQLFLVGERISKQELATLHQLAPQTRVVLLYGATESQRALSHYITKRASDNALITLGTVPPGMRLLVLNEQNKLADVGQIGQIVIASPHLAKGYLADDKLVPFACLAEWGACYYSGDLGYYTSSGEIICTGRADRQINIRGYRVEPGEIESAINCYPGVTFSRLLVNEEQNQITLFVLSDARKEELMAHLGNYLPSWMMPNAIQQINEVPLTTNGKLDETALLALYVTENTPDADRHYGEKQQQAIDLILSTLAAHGADPSRSFTHAGGSSLTALQLQSKVYREWQAVISLASILNAPSIALLASEIMQAIGESQGTSSPAISAYPQAASEPFPLNDIQSAYVAGRQKALSSTDIASQSYYEYRVHSLDSLAFEQAWNKVVAHHAGLRARLTAEWQQFSPEEVPYYAIRREDLSQYSLAERTAHLQRKREKLSNQQFDLHSWPLFLIEETVLGNETSLLHFRIDYIVADAWSWNIILGDLDAFYRGEHSSLSKSAISFRDYVLAEKEWQQSTARKAALKTLAAEIGRYPKAPQLPYIKTTEKISEPHFKRLTYQLPENKWKRIQDIARAQSITPTVLLVTLIGRVIAQWCDQKEFTLNITTFDRKTWHPDVNQIVGDFTSVIMLPMNFSAQASLTQYCLEHKSSMLAEMENQYLSGIDVLREINQSAAEDNTMQIMPVVFTSKIGLRRNNRTRYPWLGDKEYGISRTPQVWLDCQCEEDEQNNLLFYWDVLEDVFYPDTIRGMFAACTSLLDKLDANPECWREAIQVPLSFEDRQMQQLANNNRQPFKLEKLSAALSQRSAAAPDTLALVYGEGQQVSWQELYQRSTQLAAQIPTTLMEGSPVAIMLRKSVDQIAACFASHLRGCFYVPVDTSQGEERIAKILTATACQFAFSDSAEHREICRKTQTQLCLTPELVEPVFAAPPLPIQPDEGLEKTAYIIFTSGSTGEPKGVVISHAGAANTIQEINRRFSVTTADCVYGISSLNFDLSVYDIFGAVAAGAKLVLPDAQYLREPAHWLEQLHQHRVTIWNSAPALMQMLVQYCLDNQRELPDSLRLVMMSGDWIPPGLPEQIRQLAPKAQLVSLGGATEASIWSNYHEISTRAYPVSIPYGRPLANQTMYILDQHLNPCPCLTVGDIWIGGAGLADGYWNNAELTAKAFIHHPDTQERLYRTGDLGRWMPEGEIEFLGRKDFQLKINGYRVEPGEIEHALLNHPGITAAQVIAHQHAGNGKALIAYLVVEQGYALDSSALRQVLRKQLAEYMIPARFIVLDAFPLTSNGKIDRKALPVPPEEEKRITRVPANHYQNAVCQIFSEILSLPQMEPHANFFESGGTSLEVIRVQSKIQSVFNVSVQVADIFRFATPEKLGRHIEEKVMLNGTAKKSAEVPTTNRRLQIRQRQTQQRRAQKIRQ